MRLGLGTSLTSLRVASSASVPDMPAGVVHHYDFSSASNYTESGGLITAATDLGSGSADLAAASGKEPAVGSINSVGAADFDGVDNILKNTVDLDNAFDSTSAAYTIAAAFQFDTTPNGVDTYALATMAYYGATDPYVGLVGSGTSDDIGFLLRDAAANIATAYQSGQDTNAHVMVAVIRSDDTCDLWLDGTKVVTDADISTASTRQLNQHISIGGLSRSVSTEGSFLDGKIGEAAFYASALSDSDASDLSQYLKAKWGIT